VEKPGGNGQETFGYRLRRMEEELTAVRVEAKELSDRIDRMTLALLGSVLTLAVFGLGIAITLLTTRTG
jgi:hypothetical protein